MNYTVITHIQSFLWRIYLENGWEYSWVQLLFSDFLIGEFLERQYMFDILNTINTETITELGKNLRKNKWLTEEKVFNNL